VPNCRSGHFALGMMTMNLRAKNCTTRWVVCLVALVLLSALIVILLPRLPGTGPVVQFQRFTNGPGQSHLALFSVSNGDARTISFIPGYPQISTGDFWAQIASWPTTSTGSQLRSGQSTNLVLKVSADANAWRLPVLWCYELNISESLLFKSKRLIDEVSPGLLSHRSMMMVINTNYSAAIEFSAAEQ
jgi:hypothetical protein